MNLPGRLRLTTLGDLFGVLHREAATGVLELTESTGHVHRVHLLGGLLGPIESSGGGSLLGEILKRRGLVDDLLVRSVSARVSGSHSGRLGDALVDLGAITEDQLVVGLTIQRRERLEYLFSLGDARIAFRVAGARAPGASDPLGPNDFLSGRGRARDRSNGAPHVRRRDPVRVRALATLGLSEAADASSVQRAFRSLAAKVHPDRFPEAAPADRAELIRRFAELSAAYHALVA